MNSIRVRTLIQIIDADGDPIGLYATHIKEEPAEKITREIMAHIQSSEIDDPVDELEKTLESSGFTRVFVNEIVFDG